MIKLNRFIVQIDLEEKINTLKLIKRVILGSLDTGKSEKYFAV